MFVVARTCVVCTKHLSNGMVDDDANRMGEMRKMDTRRAIHETQTARSPFSNARGEWAMGALLEAVALDVHLNQN